MDGASKESRIPGRYTIVLASVLVLFATYPIVQDRPALYWLVNVVLLGVVVSGVNAAWRTPRLGRLAILFGTIISLTLVLELAWPGSRGRAVGVAHNAAMLAFLLLVALTVLGDVLRQSRVTADGVAAACCVYLFAGLGWGNAYRLVELARPGSFSTDVTGSFGLVYFSFMTLTTTGYGDISPVSVSARSLAVLESVIGQLYLAVLVARLVGLHIAHPHDSVLDPAA